MSKAIKFKDVAHMYLGCKIMTAEGIGTFNALYTGDHHEPIVSYDFVNAHLRFDEVKPVLKRMEDHTPEDEARMLEKYKHFLKTGKDPVMTMSLTVWTMTREGYDVFLLIDSGEAIDAATLGKEASHES